MGTWDGDGVDTRWLAEWWGLVGDGWGRVGNGE